jgi:GT2 family glycosyltransferase/glycosyltransferase involved in cell wall biosynthesis
VRPVDRFQTARGTVALGSLWLLKLVLDAVGLRKASTGIFARAVERTGLFDPNYYREYHLDVAESDISPIHHYVAAGDREGRAPMALFDPIHYRSQASGNTKHINAVLHYAWVGRHQRISPSPWFDLDYYLNHNNDVAAAGVDPLLHYLNWGGNEGRAPGADFDGAYYLTMNPDVMQAGMNPLLHYLTVGRFQGRSVRRPAPTDLDHAAVPQSPDLQADRAWDGLTQRSGGNDVVVDVVVPVYKGRQETLACLHSVLAARSATPFELVVINDASPDAGLAEALERLADKGLFTLHHNATNLGFVVTVNAGLALHRERDVVVLNADTEVYDGWLDRLRQAARRHPKTGTVTPLSNNATICSYPRFLHDNPYLLEIPYATLDRLAAEVNAGVEVEAPTGVGFCMYLRRDCLDSVGELDAESFGRGYGEENDFCQRAIAAGWRNVIAADVFVRHWGGASFAGEKTQRVNQAMRVMDELHPGYLDDVQRFIQRDPLAPARANLDWARLLLMRREHNVLIVSHNRGGGTEKHVQEDVERLLHDGRGVFFMRPVRTDRSGVLLAHPALHFCPNVQALALQDVAQVADRLRKLGIDEVHTHSLVDFEPESPRYMRELVRAIGARWEVNLHDYKVVCPRINLADNRGRYCGEPSEDGCNRCLIVRGSSFGVRNIRWWRNLHWQALEEADEVLVPDVDMARRLARYFPGLEVTISPHEDDVSETREIDCREARGEDRVHVVVIGAINKHKGIEVLLRCARHARKGSLPVRFSVLGYTSNDAAVRREGVEITGQYRDEDAASKLQQLCPDVIWLPSIWPETYCYTLSLALRFRRPIVAFDLGAIATRLRRAGRADHLMPLSMAENPAQIIAEFLKIGAPGGSPGQPVPMAAERGHENHVKQ